jgi:hypothetical protein
MQQVAKLPESLVNSKDPLKELAEQLDINQPQVIEFEFLKHTTKGCI